MLISIMVEGDKKTSYTENKWRKKGENMEHKVLMEGNRNPPWDTLLS